MQAPRGLHQRLALLATIRWLLDPDVRFKPDLAFTPLAVLLLTVVLWPDVYGAPPPDQIQRLLDALRTISTSHRAMERYTTVLQGQRDRLIVELSRAKITLREIAPWAGMHHTRIGKILKKAVPDARFLLLTQEIPDWNVVTFEEAYQFLRKHFPTGPPPTSEELAGMLTAHRARMPDMEGNSRAYIWYAAHVYDVFERAARDLDSVTVLNVLSATRAMMLSATWRVVMVGEDREVEIREMAMSLAARLLDNVRQDDWMLDFLTANIPEHLDPWPNVTRGRFA
jgi:hypothetical protein